MICTCTNCISNGALRIKNALERELAAKDLTGDIQVVQTGFDTLEVRYVPDGTNAAADQPGLEAWLREELDPCFAVQLKEVDAIERSSDGKYEDFVSLVGERQSGA